VAEEVRLELGLPLAAGVQVCVAVMVLLKVLVALGLEETVLLLVAVGLKGLVAVAEADRLGLKLGVLDSVEAWDVQETVGLGEGLLVRDGVQVCVGGTVVDVNVGVGTKVAVATRVAVQLKVADGAPLTS
jgi:hypothetical protein